MLVICRRCGGNACLETKLENGLTTWIDFGCGFTASTEITKDSEQLRTIMLTAPELYKDLLFIDSQDIAWLPSTVTLPEKGMVFIDGTGKDDWAWSAVKAVKITEEEKNRFPVDQKYKMEVRQAKKFSQSDFMDALSEIDFFSLDQ